MIAILLLSFATVPAQASGDNETGISYDHVTIYVRNAVTFTVQPPSPGRSYVYTYLRTTWDFGDGTVIEYEGLKSQHQHIYEKTGTYQVRCSGTYMVFYVYSLYGRIIKTWCGTDSFDYSITINVISIPPVADAGGPYTGYEGSSVTFDGTRSYDPDGEIVEYAWDLDGDGEFDDAFGPTVSYTWGDDYQGNIGLRVTDNMGATDTDMVTLTESNIQVTDNAGVGATDMDTARITVLNVDPIARIDSVEQPQEFELGDLTVIMLETVSFAGTVYDPGNDDLTLAWDWGDGTAATLATYLNDPPSYPVEIRETVEHVYTEPGEYTVTITVEDDDGGVGTDTLTIRVWGPQDLNKDSICKLESTPSNPHTPKKIQDAIDHIRKSLNIDPKDPSKPWKKYDLWADGIRLDPEHGKKVFDEEKEAFLALKHLLEKDDTPRELKEACQATINKLIKACDLLARTAHDEAQAEAGDPKVDRELKECDDEFNKAEREVDKGHYDKAIDHYMKAWEHAQKALKHAT